MTTPYLQSKEAGYSDPEIVEFLSTHPKYGEKVKKSREAGYSDEEIGQFLSTHDFKEEKPERTTSENALRAATQFGLGVAESVMLPYDISVTPLNTTGYQVNASLQRMGEDIEFLYEKNMGKPVEEWDQQDQDLYNFISDRIMNPQKVAQEVTPVDISVQGLSEKATGENLHPETGLEMGARWLGWIKDPKNIASTGMKAVDFLKGLMPTGTEFTRAVGAGTMYNFAKQGGFGPIGQLAATVLGDLLGGGVAAGVKGAKELITKPKETLAKKAAEMTSAEKVQLQKDLIKEFRESGLQADLGTITDNNLIRWMQSRMAQSGLVGEDLKNFKNELTQQIKSEYSQIADALGEAKFSTNHEAGEVLKETMNQIRDADLSKTRDLYKNANEMLKDGSTVNASKLNASIDRLEKELRPGSIKSGEQRAVLDALEKLKGDISQGKASVKDLMNNKIALNDIINYEVQGGAKQLLKGIVGELDRAIISHGRENIPFVKNYIQANKRFAQHAKTFRNKNVEQILRSPDPAKLLTKMNSIQGIRDLENVLKRTSQGQDLFNDLKRLKLDQVIGKRLEDSVTQQVRLGTFSKLLEKGNNREVIKEILKQDFKRLDRLQKNAGKLADSANKFFNASQSGIVAADMAIVAQTVSAIAQIMGGNPWPILKIGGTVIGAKKLSKLMADPEFLRLTEEAILASEKGSLQEMSRVFERMQPYVQALLQEGRQ